MISIEIPEWVQWAAFWLAVSYAAPRALRVILVTISVVIGFFQGIGVLPELRQDGVQRLRVGELRGNASVYVQRLVAWAFKVPPPSDDDPDAWGASPW